MKKYSSLFLVFILSLPLLGACSDEEHKDHDGVHQASNGDLREQTESAEVIPTFLDDKSENMQNIYRAAAMHQDLLENIPCYCGCGESANHKNNYDCFIHENKKDGSLVWDDHATRCKACLDIAVKSILEYKDGKSIKEIRTMIDEQYKDGFGEPTPTPEV
ncbi:PCYCGC domain-containing protein [Pseudalkalibacillus salsuginis]|uniref:PCYCGC domain-containing protein n=1 Tax=Pseudalkalibacillus salsuginis TaxID=2910972 RepID=UPI001F249205|nr:PCYCGC domain-containing protein [Pseudalkalibacillus salsuginis]MCF6411686.1 PCYCGC domain-containing protein [Pseudalkalibacillus salsuginis]